MISCRVEIRCKDFLLISKTWDFLWKMSVITYLLSPSATFDISCLGAPRTEVLVGLVLEELIPCRGVFACRPYENEHIIGCGFWWTHNLFKDTSKWWDTKIELKVKWFYGRIGKKKMYNFRFFSHNFHVMTAVSMIKPSWKIAVSFRGLPISIFGLDLNGIIP